MTQKAMAELPDVEQPAIAKNLINIYNEKELDKDSTYSKMKLVQKEGNRNFNKKDEFKTPFINFNVKKEYNELSNIIFTSKSGNEYMIYKAIQTISFSLDEKGGRIKSEATIDAMKTTAMENYEEKRYFNVDSTFVLFLKEEGKDRPYFAARIDDIRKYQ